MSKTSDYIKEMSKKDNKFKQAIEKEKKLIYKKILLNQGRKLLDSYISKRDKKSPGFKKSVQKEIEKINSKIKK